MRKKIAVLAGIAILVLVNYTIYSRERLLAEGSTVLLELAPVDPRSLMQGDYMALRFQVANALRTSTRGNESRTDGLAVVALDERRVGTFVRVDQGTPLAANEMKIRYRVRNDQVKFATNAFFFQEGTSQLYARAKFGEFRVDPKGDAILVALKDDALATLGNK